MMTEPMLLVEQEIKKIEAKGLPQLREPSLEDYRNIKMRLAKIIRHLMDTDLHKLLSIFYRIDVPEEQVKIILSSSDPQMIEEELAELVIKRQIQKIITRRKYQ